MLEITPIAVLDNNYIWCIIHPKNRCCAIVDPGSANEILDSIQQQQLKLVAILVTHHHSDHNAGIAEILQQHQAPVYGPKITTVTTPLQDQQPITLNELQLQLTTIATPGHTLDHLCYFGQQLLFSGDTLFSAGCGRVFEGTQQQMYNSLQKLAALPDDTKLYCAHEYTRDNLNFAKNIEPDNQELQNYRQQVQQLYDNHQPTLPSNLKLEKAINPFLRCHIPEIIAEAELHVDRPLQTPIDVFTVLRDWKNNRREL